MESSNNYRKDNNQIQNKSIPYNYEAEMGVLNNILIDSNSIIHALDVLSPEDFYDFKNKTIYTAMVDLYKSGNNIDIRLLKSKLEESNNLEKIGGLSYLMDILNFTYSSLNFDNYIKNVSEASLKRKTISTLKQLSQNGFDSTLNVNDYLESVESEIYKLTQYRNTSEFINISQICEDVIRNEEELAQRKEDVTGLNTGFENLNSLTFGLQRGNLIILAARPAMGKSAYALNLAVNCARTNKNGKASVAVFSLEMGADQLVQRMFAAESGIVSDKIRSGTLNDDDWRSLRTAARNLSSLNIYFDQQGGTTVGEIRSKCRKLKQSDRGLDLIVIDYLQLISGGKENASKVEEVSIISRALKLLARELDVPVVALSQLSRRVEQRDDNRPTLSDLRDSGSIEQDADIVCFLYREAYYKKNNSNKCELIIAKNRAGSLATLNYIFDGSIQKFSEIGVEENK